MSSTPTRSRAALVGALAAALLVPAGVAVWARPGHDAAPASRASAAAPGGDGTEVTAADSPESPAPASTTTVAPAPTTAPPASTTPTTTASRTAPKATTPTTAPAPRSTSPSTAPPAAAAPVAPKFTPGQRINPTSAQVQAAIASLHQRIPLFEPTEPQLRTFADATCTSFDQGRTFTEVRDTVRQAVTYIQGASLSAADADFAVRTVVQLRCPGYAA